MRTVYDVTAKLVCKHDVTERGLSKVKMQRAEETMRLSAFCATCGRFQPSKQVFSQMRKDF